MNQDGNTGQNEVKVVRGRVDSLSLYEVTDNELEILEKGSPSSIYLNFSIFLLSIGIAFLITLLSTNIESSKVFAVFVIFCSVGIVVGVLLLVLWYRMKNEVSEVIVKIKGRIA